MATILSSLNKCTDSLVGLEYLVEVKRKVTTKTKFSNYFCCILCDVECKNHSNTLLHMVSFKHRVAYLKRHYPKTMQPALPLLQTQECLVNPSEWVVQRIRFICNEAEKRFGRMTPIALSVDGLIAKRKRMMNGWKQTKYLEDFVVKTFRTEDVEHQLELLGMSNVDFGGNQQQIQHTNKQQPMAAAVDMTRQPTENKQPTKPHYSTYGRSEMGDAQIIAEYHKRYSAMFASVLENQKKYQKDPHSHPKYPAEWDLFWKERSREFDSAGKDPYDHDFTREWSLYWLERVKQLDIATIDSREKDIRLALNIPEDLDIPSLDEGRKQMFGHDGENNSEEPSSNHSNKRSGQFDNQEHDAKRSKILYDPFEGFHDSDDGDLRSTFDRDERPDTDFRQSPLESDYYDQHQPSTSHQDENNTNDPVSIISVLRLLAAFEDLLGNSLGPKVVDLLSKAVALEKVRPNLSDDLLVSEENNVLLDTVKEKMKGLLLTGFVKTAQIPAVRKVIAHVNKINNIIELRVKAKAKRAMKNARQNLQLTREKERKEQELAAIEFRKDVYQQLETSIALQGKQITPDQLETLTNVYIEKHTVNDTPYLFGLQMGSRFPDLPPRNAGNNQLPGEQQPHGSIHEFGQMSSAQGNQHQSSNDNNNTQMTTDFGRRDRDEGQNYDQFQDRSHSQTHVSIHDYGQMPSAQGNPHQSSNDNNNPQMTTNFARRDRDEGQNYDQFQDYSQSQSLVNPNENRRFSQNDVEPFNQNQISANNQRQQWPNSVHQNEFIGAQQHQRQQQQNFNFGRNQQQHPQFPNDIGNQHQQRSFNNGDIQQADFQFNNNNGSQFSNNGRQQFSNNGNQFDNNGPNRSGFSRQRSRSRRRNRRPLRKNRAQNNGMINQ